MSEKDGRESLPHSPSGWEDDTFAHRRARLTRRTRQIATVGVALAGFVVGLAAGDAASTMYVQVPAWLRAVVFTLIVVAGGCLGAAYIRFEDEVNRIAVQIDRGAVKGEDPIGAGWPESAERLWLFALISTIMAPLAFLVAAWWASIAP